MRKDINKLLCERERRPHATYGPYRNMKRFSVARHDQEELSDLPQREGMKKRHKDKSFNENLNPLYGFIHKNVGKKWDDVYSEICSSFDKRKVINQHILLHLFQYVETNCKVDDHGIYVVGSYIYGNKHEYLEQSRRVEYYVDPTTGILCRNSHYKTWKQESRERKEKEQREKDAVHRVLAPNVVAHKFNGLWYKFDHIDCPSPQKYKVFSRPEDDNLDCHHYGGKGMAEADDHAIEKQILTYCIDQLHEGLAAEFRGKRNRGDPQLRALDIKHPIHLCNDGTKKTAGLKYHTNKKALSKKELKKYNLK